MEEIYNNGTYKILLPNEIKDIININALNYIKNNISIEILSENIISERETSSLWLYGRHVCGRCLKMKNIGSITLMVREQFAKLSVIV